METDHGTKDARRAISTVAGQRACDNCRSRKIKCDRKPPCSHCRTAGLTCRVSTQRPKEQRSRVIISKEYETKIDRIENRLAGIEELLRHSLSPYRQSKFPPPGDSVGINDFHNSPEIDHLEEDSSTNVLLSGFSGPNADSIQAKDVVEQTVEGNAMQDPQLNYALTCLRNIVDRSKIENSGSPVTAPSPAELTLPPWPEVETLLKRAEVETSTTFTLCFPSTDIKDFMSKCKELYDRDQEGTPARRLLVYAGLFCICTEYSALDDERADYYSRIQAAFQRFTQRTIATFPLVLSASRENIEALMAGASFAIDICKPSLSWIFTDAAARLCQTLGYHRISTMSNDSEAELNKKVSLFWIVYIMDKGTSLRLGRASAIQDYDIAIPKPQESEDFPSSFIHLMSFWIDLARIQGQVCEQLYSPAASTQPNEIRARRANQLAHDLRQVYNRRSQNKEAILTLFSRGGSTGFKASQLIDGGDTVMHYSTLTLILHAVPTVRPTTSPALDAARAALQACFSLGSFNIDNKYFWACYSHWVTLNCPLTPFTVVFCHILSNYHESQADLQLLTNFVKSLERSRTASEGVEKFYQLCSVFCTVAECYVRAKNQEAHSFNGSSYQNMALNGDLTNSLHPVIGEFDGYLSALGFAPPLETGNMPASTSAMETDMSTYLQDWYIGNASLYGLLEEDLGASGDFGFDQGPAWSA